MAEITRREDFFGGRSNAPFIFPNDFNSRNSIEKLAQAEAEEKARKAKSENDAAELQRLRISTPLLEADKASLLKLNGDLTRQKSLLETEKASLQSEKAAADTGRATTATEHERQLGDLKHQLAQFHQDYNLMKTRLSQTDYRTNLDQAYHEREVFIVLACAPHTAIDLGGSGGTAAYGYEFNRTYGWQGLRLRRVDYYWTISSTYSTDRYLGVNSTTGAVESQSGRGSGDGATYQEWIIGLNSTMTGYLIESRPKGWLHMDIPREIRNGKSLTQVSKNETSDSQVWHILFK